MTIAFNTTLILALFAAMALRPPMPRHSSPFNLPFVLGWWINEVPLVGLWGIIAGTTGTLTHPEPVCGGGWLPHFTAVDVLLLGWIAVRARSARPALSVALQTVYGPRATPRYTRPAWWRLLLPVISWRPDVRRIRNRGYGPARRGNRLDVYVSRRVRAGAGPAPVLVYFHAAFGSKMLGSRALIYRLAAQGWVCVAARAVGSSVPVTVINSPMPGPPWPGCATTPRRMAAIRIGFSRPGAPRARTWPRLPR